MAPRASRTVFGWSALSVAALCLGIQAYCGFYVFDNFGLGLRPDILRAVEFFRANELRGPIFNDYDIGGYLIYGLYPEERVFVDNRPEAYPADFFRQMYVPMQLDEKRWKQVDAGYHFNMIILSRTDLAQRTRHFFSGRMQDPEWVPIFADARTEGRPALPKDRSAARVARAEPGEAPAQCSRRRPLV